MRRASVPLISVVVLLSIVAPRFARAQEVPTRADWERVQRELATLREEMHSKDAEVADLRERFDRLSQETRAATEADAELGAALADLRARLDAHPEGLQPTPEYPHLHFSGEVRFRPESREGYDFGSGTRAPSDSFVLQRVRFAADVRTDEDTRLYIQLQDSRTWGEETSTTDTNANGFDLHQGYIDLEGMTGDDDVLRVGRQELLFGAQRLISPINWSNTGRSFDGLRWIGKFDSVEANVFATQLAKTRDETGLSAGAGFGGIYTTIHPFAKEDVQQADLDLYVLYLHDDERYMQQNLWTPGARFELETHCGLYFEAEGALQFGNTTSGDPTLPAPNPQTYVDVPFGEVYAYALRFGWRFRDCDWQPAITVEANHATGDKDPTDGRNQRFNPLFPLGHSHQGMIDLIFWQNTRNVALRLSAKPEENLELFAETWGFWVDQVSDEIIGPSFRIPGLAGSSRYAGLEFDLRARWKARSNLYIEPGASMLLPGSHIEDVLGSNDPAFFAYLMMGLSF